MLNYNFFSKLLHFIYIQAPYNSLYVNKKNVKPTESISLLKKVTKYLRVYFYKRMIDRDRIERPRLTRSLRENKVARLRDLNK